MNALDAGVLRLLFTVIVLGGLGLFERILPRRRPVAPAGRRWLANLGLGGASFLLARLLVPFVVSDAAYQAEGARFGLLNQFTMPLGLKWALTILGLDFALWLQHLATHKMPLLWRLHAVHHTELDLDASSGVRFHPLEIMLSLLWKSAFVVLLGGHFLAAAGFELLVFAAAAFNHANLRLPGFADSALRLVLVTPDMHRVHHSPNAAERDSNYGFCAPWWDRLFGTYVAQPAEPHESMTLGLAESRENLGLYALLSRPFRRTR